MRNVRPVFPTASPVGKEDYNKDMKQLKHSNPHVFTQLDAHNKKDKKMLEKKK